MSSLREVNIKNCGQYYDDTINIEDLDFNKILVYKRPYEKINYFYYFYFYLQNPIQ